MIVRLQDRNSRTTLLMPVKSVWDGAIIEDNMTDYYAKLLRYHIVPQTVITAAIRAKEPQWTAVASALNDEPLYFRQSARGTYQVMSSSGSLVTIVEADIASANGAIQLIDGALFPRGYSMGADRRLYVQGVNAPVATPTLTDASAVVSSPMTSGVTSGATSGAGMGMSATTTAPAASAPVPVPASLASTPLAPAPAPAPASTTVTSTPTAAAASTPAASSSSSTALPVTAASVPARLPVPLYSGAAETVPTYAQTSGAQTLVPIPVGLVSTPLVLH
jgi:hypothetical protein